ncbi:MAG: hypothetical protein ACOC1X_00575 [Promethearchaeota archaeon]
MGYKNNIPHEDNDWNEDLEDIRKNFEELENSSGAKIIGFDDKDVLLTASDVQNAIEEVLNNFTAGGNVDLAGNDIVDIGNIKYKETYGIYFDYENDEISRINTAEDLTQSDFDDIYPWSEMRRCNLSDGGEVNAYHDEAGYEEDGSNGEVMVEIPKFWYRSYSDENGKAWLISPERRDGYKLHPAFVKSGKEMDYIYFSAYEGCAYDDSESDYITDDSQDIDWDDDLLSSIADVQPLSGDSQDAHIENCRKIAENRGEGWGLIDFLSVSAVQLLFIIEYANFDMQSAISEGITNLDSGSGNNSQNTGHTSSLGNESGEVVISSLENGAEGADETYAMSYRGIENIFGNIWTWVDGINIKGDHKPYIADHGYESDLFEDPYYPLNMRLPDNNDYMMDNIWTEEIDFAFLPSEVGGSSSTYFCDYYYQNTGDRVARLGGSWADGSQAGLSRWALGSSSSYSDRSRSARLLYRD